MTNANTIIALAALFISNPLMLAEDFATLALEIGSNTTAVGVAWDHMIAAGDINLALVTEMEAKSLVIWESSEAARKAAAIADEQRAYDRAQHVNAGNSLYGARY